MATMVSSAPRQRSKLRRVLASPTTARVLFPFFVIALWYAIYFAIDSRIFPTPLRVAEFMWGR
jgi:ABC-type nitrate/sulfonate/bicarbonate transport system permease component